MDGMMYAINEELGWMEACLDYHKDNFKKIAKRILRPLNDNFAVYYRGAILVMLRTEGKTNVHKMET